MSDDNTQVLTPEAPVESPAPAEAPKKRQMSFSVLDDGQIRAEFGEGVDPILLNPVDVPESLRLAAVTDGLISRLRGYTSRLSDEARTPKALAEAVAKGVSALKSGVWKIEREAGGATEFSQEIHAAFLFRAMRAAKKNEEFTGTIEEAAANWAALDDEQKKKVKALPLYQQALAEVKAKAAQAKAEKLAKKVEDLGDDAGF